MTRVLGLGSRDAMSNENTMVKIVYFDEGSATDYIQINNGGKLNSVIELFDESEAGGNADADAKIGIGTKVLKALLGFDTSVEVDGHLGTSFNSGSVAKSIVSNTVLTDFIEAVEAGDEKLSSITVFTDYRIEQIQGSLSSFTLLTPYLSMFKSGQGFSAGEYDISIDKLDSTLSKAKGYLEFLGRKDSSSDILLRFNSNAFKNNYRPSDLLKMDLIIYAVRVGSCYPSDLIADNELKFDGAITADNPDYIKELDNKVDLKETEALMYDVILAGVGCHGK